MKRIYVDMDGVLCNYAKRYAEKLQSNPHNLYPQSDFDFFRSLEEIPGGVETVKRLSEIFDVWILTRPSFRNPMCYTEKRLWIEDHLGIEWCERLILSPDKSLLIGDYLIDDTIQPFNGVQIIFGSPEFSDWNSVLTYLSERNE